MHVCVFCSMHAEVPSPLCMSLYFCMYYLFYFYLCTTPTTTCMARLHDRATPCESSSGDIPNQITPRHQNPAPPLPSDLPPYAGLLQVLTALHAPFQSRIRRRPRLPRRPTAWRCSTTPPRLPPRPPWTTRRKRRPWSTTATPTPTETPTGPPRTTSKKVGTNSLTHSLT